MTLSQTDKEIMVFLRQEVERLDALVKILEETKKDYERKIMWLTKLLEETRAKGAGGERELDG